MSFAIDIAARIVAAGLGSGIQTDIFLGSKAALPSRSENVGPYISLNDTGGTAAIETHGSRYPRPSLQIVVRAASAPIAKTRAEAIHAILCSEDNITIGTTFYLRISTVQEVMDMQPDEVGRPRFGFNINCLKT